MRSYWRVALLKQSHLALTLITLEDTVKTDNYIDARWSQEDDFWSRWHTVGILLVFLFH